MLDNDHKDPESKTNDPENKASILGMLHNDPEQRTSKHELPLTMHICDGEFKECTEALKDKNSKHDKGNVNKSHKKKSTTIGMGQPMSTTI